MSEESSGGLRILYVDSDPGRRATIVEGLTSIDDGLTVETAGTVEAAVKQTVGTTVDVVIAAHDLADGTGTELIDEIATRRPDVLTALYPREGSESIAAEAVTAGADAYQSGGGCEELYATLDDALDDHDARTEALDRMTDGFFALDDEWRITYINDRGREIVREAMGEKRRAEIDDLHGVSLWDAVPDAVETPFYDRYHEAMETQKPVAFEEYYEPMDRWFEVNVYPSPVGVSVYLRDVTDRERYQEELQRREEILTFIYRVVADKDRSFEQKVEELLEVGREELGVEYGSLSRVDGDEYTFEVVAGPEESAVEAGDVVPLSWTTCERAVTTREHLVIDDMSEQPAALADRRGNQELGLGCYLGTPVVVDGSVYGTFCFYGQEPRKESFSQWQITLVDLMGNWVSYECEREHREEKLSRERERLEEFASVVSHDLRNPLNVANARLELASDECDSEQLDEVERALDRMDELIDDILSLARGGQEVVDSEAVDFTTVVREAWGTTSSDDGTLVVEDGIETVVGDDSRLRQLFENLFRNAVEHGGEDVTVTVGPLDDRPGFFVEDDGSGIPDDERGKIFDRGYSTREGGTGFGLSIVEQIVDAHGGTISVTEGRDGGARFEIAGIDVR